MKKWLFVTLGLLLAVPVHAKSVPLRWGTWSNATFTATGDTTFFNGTNTSVRTNRIELKNINLNPIAPEDPNGTSMANVQIKVVVSGTPVGSAGYLNCLAEKSVDGYVWETVEASTFVLGNSPTANVVSGAYSGTLALAFAVGTATQPLPYLRFKIFDGSGATAKISGARVRVSYDESDYYEQVVKPGKWAVDANTSKDTTTVLGFTGRDTTTAFNIEDILPRHFGKYGTIADTANTCGAFLVLKTTNNSPVWSTDSLYVCADVSYDGGSTWAGNAQFGGYGIGNMSNNFGDLLINFNNGDATVLVFPLQVIQNTTLGATANSRSALWLWGATNVRFRVATTAAKATATIIPYIVYWREKS